MKFTYERIIQIPLMTEEQRKSLEKQLQTELNKAINEKIQEYLKSLE